MRSVETRRAASAGIEAELDRLDVQVRRVVLGLVGGVAGFVATVLTGLTGVGLPVAVATLIGTVASLLMALGAAIQLALTTGQVQGNLLDSARSGFSHTWANHAQFATVR